MQSEVKNLPADYYDFGSYVTRARWLTYYRQLVTILSAAPERVLEVGVGPGIVRTTLRERGVDVKTVDVNASLKPDYVADLRAMPDVIRSAEWDWVLCSRVLHHIPRAEVNDVLDQLAELRAERILLTVPREDLSIQVTMRRTAGAVHFGRLALGSYLKKILRQRSLIKSDPSGVWMLNGANGITLGDFAAALSERFTILEQYVLPDDPSHVFFVLRRVKA